MDRRTPRGRRWRMACHAALIGGSLLPAGCTRSPREVFSQAWRPVKELTAGVWPGSGASDPLAARTVDPFQDPFLVGPNAPSEFAAGELKTADASPEPNAASPVDLPTVRPADVLATGSDPSGQKDGRAKKDGKASGPAKPAVAASSAPGLSGAGRADDADDFESAVAALRTSPVTEEPVTAPTPGDPFAEEFGSDEAQDRRQRIAHLMKAARSHREQNRLRDAYRAAKAAETMARMAGIEYADGEDAPATLAAELRGAMAEARRADSSQPGRLAEVRPARKRETNAAEPPSAPTPAESTAAVPEIAPDAFAEPETIIRSAAKAALDAASPESQPSPDQAALIVESDDLPSRFEQGSVAPRALLQPPSTPVREAVAMAAAPTIPAAPVVPAAPAVPSEKPAALTLFQASANDGAVVELEGPNETPQIIPRVAREQANPEAVPRADVVPAPEELATATTADEALIAPPPPVETPAPPVVVALAEPPAAAAPTRALRNVQWDDAPRPAPQASRLPDWWPAATGWGVAAVLALWLLRRRSG